MITVREAQDSARGKLRRHLATWATQLPVDDAGYDGSPLVTIALKPPTEKEMLNDERGAEAWARAWRALPLDRRAVVEWETRTWRSIGRQDVPVRLHLHDADAVAAFVGGSLATDYGRLKASAAAMYGRFGPTDALASALRRHASTVLAYTDAERTTVEEVLDWLLATDVTGLRPRQLPIRGVDSKWFASHRTVLSALHTAITGATSLGVVDSDPLVRVRILDPRIAPGGIQDFSAPARQLASLTFEPRIALVVENLETLLALPSWPGIVAIHGSGYAVDVLGGVPWLLRTPIVYWGDLDSHGFAILHRLRTAHPDVTTALMDIATLDAHRDLWVPEPKPTRGTFSTLTEQEAATLRALRAAGDVRLEQERIPWAYALTELEQSALGRRD